jgi:DNA-binding protein YbaB
MATFEEDVVKAYYNLNNYFTIESVPFRAKEKRTGGKGRGEIDLIAIKINKDNERLEEAIHVEVTASIDAKFPFVSKKGGADEVYKLLKKFFKSDADNKLAEYYSGKYKYQFITSPFAKEVSDKLKKRLKDFKAKIIDYKMNDKAILITIKYNGKIKQIEIIPFTVILKRFVDLIQERKEYFSKITIRAMQWFSILKKEYPNFQ